MSNSRWKPYSECPKNGTFLIWHPDVMNERTHELRSPYLTGNISIASRCLNQMGSQIDIIDGKFCFDTYTPVLFADIVSEMENEIPLEYTEIKPKSE